MKVYTVRAVTPSGGVMEMTYCVESPAEAKERACAFVARICQCSPERVRIASCRKER